MVHINEFIKILPIKCEDKELNLLTFNDMDWYIQNCKQPYYEKFIDFKFSSDITDEKLRELIYNMIVGYRLCIPSQYEARVLMKNNNNIYGGCTIFEKSNDNLEIAYFILPEYQGKGLGEKMVRDLCIALNNSEIPFKRITLTIQDDNRASVKLAEKVGFKLLYKEPGKYKTNIIMFLDRTCINEIE